MGIEYLEEEGLFRLTAGDAEYVIGIADGKYVGHVYFGRQIGLSDADRGGALCALKESEGEMFFCGCLSGGIFYLGSGGLPGQLSECEKRGGLSGL